MNTTNKYHTIARKALSYIIPLIVFWCVSAFCFSPQFAGKVLPQHDITQYEGMSRDLREHYDATGEDAQWTGAMFGGMPAYLISVRYPSLLVKNTVGQIVKAVGTPTGFLFFAMTAMWVMMLIFGISPWVGMVAALAYGLSTYFFLIIGAGHVTKMWALVYAPLMMAGIWVTMRRNMWAGGVLTALFASLEIGANHPQITYYFLLAAAIFWISEAVAFITEKKSVEFLKRTAVLIVAGLVAVGSNFAPLWYTSQHSPDTIRGGSELVAASDNAETEGLDLNYATAWSYGIAESWNMLIPDFAGGDSARPLSTTGETGNVLAPYGMRQTASQLPAYWGGQPYTAGPTYLGAAAIFFALLGLMLVKGRDRWWIVAAMILMLFLAWGRNFMWFTELCFNHLPMYNKFRTVSMTLTFIEWAVPLMAGLALWKMWQSKDEERRSLLINIAVAGGITGGLCLFMLAFAPYIFSFGAGEFAPMLEEAGFPADIASATDAAMVTDRIAIMKADAWRSLLFVLLAVGTSLLFAAKRLPKWALITLAAAIVTVDLVSAGLRFQPKERFVAAHEAKIEPTFLDEQILEDKELGYRVLNRTVSPFNDATTSLFHRSVGGYHGAKLARYQDIIDIYMPFRRENDNVLDMLNTKYLIDGRGVVIQRPGANGPAWLVRRTVKVPDAEAEIVSLDTLHSRTTAVASPVIKGSKEINDIPVGTYRSGKIRLTEYAPNRLKYEYAADSTAFAVFSEIFYNKGWSAYIDGSEEPAPYYRVDYILRGMELPAGEHTVEWRFRAPGWTTVNAITACFSALILAAAAALAIITILRLCKYGQRKQTA